MSPNRWVVRDRPRPGPGVGCLALIVALVVVAPLVHAFTQSTPFTILAVAIATVALVRLWARWRITTTPLCPHCGVRADDRFRTCRACGRVK